MRTIIRLAVCTPSIASSISSAIPGASILAVTASTFWLSLQVLDVEAKHLGQSTALIAALRACIAALDDAVR